jgi:hypothetical protein
MPAITSLKSPHPAECPAILVAEIATAIPALIAGAAAFNDGFAGPKFRGLVRPVRRPPAVNIDIHRPIIVVNINVAVPPMEAAPVIGDRGARVIPAAALAGFLRKRLWNGDWRGAGG